MSRLECGPHTERTRSGEVTAHATSAMTPSLPWWSWSTVAPRDTTRKWPVSRRRLGYEPLTTERQRAWPSGPEQPDVPSEYPRAVINLRRLDRSRRAQSAKPRQCLGRAVQIRDQSDALVRRAALAHLVRGLRSRARACIDSPWWRSTQMMASMIRPCRGHSAPAARAYCPGAAICAYEASFPRQGHGAGFPERSEELGVVSI